VERGRVGGSGREVRRGRERGGSGILRRDLTQKKIDSPVNQEWIRCRL